MPSSSVVTRRGDPNIYLNVMGKWYCYNPYNSLLGSGAMGDVYLGRCCQTNVFVAIKRVKDAYAKEPSIRLRAKTEASIIFRHEHMVEMIGYCEYAPNYGPIFLVSKYVRGQNIDDYIRNLDKNVNKQMVVCNAMCAVLDALALVHSHNIVHRDVKPSNIMVENDNNVRLMDLGIARLEGGNSYSSNGYIGTPEYSAPEQMKQGEDGSKFKIDATTDIYELGITMYELLDGTNPMKCDRDADTLQKQLKEPLPVSESIPPRLMKVILKATQKKQVKRYQNVKEFKQAILDAQKPILSPFDNLNIWLQEHLKLASSLIVLFILISAIIFFILFF